MSYDVCVSNKAPFGLHKPNGVVMTAYCNKTSMCEFGSFFLAFLSCKRYPFPSLVALRVGCPFLGFSRVQLTYLVVWTTALRNRDCVLAY